MASRLRVAVVARAVAPSHGLGGLERHVFDVVEHLRHNAVDVTLVTRSGVEASSWLPASASRGQLTLIEVPYVTFPYAGRRGTTILDRDTAYPFFGWRAGRRVRALVASGHIDVVYGLGASVFGYALVREPGRGDGRAPLVFNPQGLEEFGATNPNAVRIKRLAYAPLQAVVRTCARRADRVIATDRVLVDVVRRHLLVGDDVVRVVPNAVDVERCDTLGARVDIERLRGDLHIPPDHRVLLSVGRLEHNKGFHVLVQALTRLDPALPWTSVVVGDGPWRSEIARRIADAGLASRVRLIGRQSDEKLHGWYRAATVFVHPTLYEGSSLVTLEAMTHRLPVVASAAGGLPDKVMPGVNGWLVPPGDVEALAAALHEALEAADLGPLGQASRRLVEREFSWLSVAERLIGVCEEARRAPRFGRAEA